IENRTTNTELIAFITPVVVENTEQADQLYEKDRDRLNDMREKEFGGKGRDLPKSLEEGGSAPTNPPTVEPAPGDHPAGSMGGLSPHAPEPLLYADIITMSEDQATREATLRENAAHLAGLDDATRSRLMDESVKCRERAQVARETAPLHVPAPLADSIIAVLDVEGAMKEWKARSAASKRDALDTATRVRLADEAEKCRRRMIAASNE
ncbi:MAG: hypothetical protein AB7G11_10375, partial [Phycisphaerales bacterium]